MKKSVDSAFSVNVCVVAVPARATPPIITSKVVFDPASVVFKTQMLETLALSVILQAKFMSEPLNAAVALATIGGDASIVLTPS